MSFANEFRRALKDIDEELAYYGNFLALEGLGESREVLVDLREKWLECRARSEARGKLPAIPEDWAEDVDERRLAKERMNKLIKAAALAAEAARAAKTSPAIKLHEPAEADVAADDGGDHTSENVGG